MLPPRATAATNTNEMQDRGPTIVTLLVVFTIISALFIAARLFVRIKLLRNLGTDDYLITLAW
ncbi:hypothetical protein KC331_g19738, partial [Hortaea werneckii]